MVLVVTWMPPIIQEFGGPESRNLIKIAAFFGHHREVGRPPGEALGDWATATSWLPERLGRLGLPEDGPIPFGMRWDPIAPGASISAWSVAALLTVCVVVAGAVAFRRRDRPSLALIGFGALGDVVAIASLRAIGESDRMYSLFFWTTAASAVTWMGVLAALGGALHAASRGHRALAGRVAIVAGMVAALASTVLQRRWLSRYPFAPASSPEVRNDLASVYAAVVERARRDGTVPVVHREGAWDAAAGIALEFDRDGVDWRIAAEDAWAFPSARRAAATAQERHVWFASPFWPLPRLVPCLELVVTSGSLSAYTAPSDVPSCPGPR